MVLLLNNFSHLNEVSLLGLREAGWKYRRIAARIGDVSLLSAVGRIVRAASREDIRAHVAPAVSPRSIGKRLQDSDHCASDQATTSLDRQAMLWCCETVDWRVEWRSVS